MNQENTEEAQMCVCGESNVYMDRNEEACGWAGYSLAHSVAVGCIFDGNNRRPPITCCSGR